MLRSLVGYWHLPGAAGNKLIGDLATAVPTPTNNGLTYTYHIRPGVKFSPPVNREVTSKDVAWAMNRLASPKDGGQYSFYYTVIKGWDAVANGTAKTVSGITTPDNSTIVFQLTKPAGDFNLRMSMPATAPIPSEIGKCFEGKPGDYGRDVVSSGPYMLQGADKVTANCATLKPMSGYDGANGNHIILVRNPNYDQSTDKYRKNYPDTFKFLVNSNADDIFAKVQAGQLEDEVSSPAPKTIREYATTPSLKPMMIANVGDRTNYFTMNLTQPPFDDVHIRKAMNWITDKAALQKAWGGPIPGVDRDPHRPAGPLQQRPRRVRPLRVAEQRGRSREGAARGQAVEVRPAQDRQVQHRVCVPRRARDRGHPCRRHAHDPDSRG